MPKQKRWTIKRELDQANGHINLAIDQLVTTGHQYEGVHDEYYEAFVALIRLLNMAWQQIELLKDKI